MRGLKLQFGQLLGKLQGVAPFVGAWIETSDYAQNIFGFDRSHPLWVRGLKLGGLILSSMIQLVAPFVGAWIETNKEFANGKFRQSRTLCGCVD